METSSTKTIPSNMNVPPIYQVSTKTNKIKKKKKEKRSMGQATTNKNLRNVVKQLKQFTPKNEWFAPEQLWEKCCRFSAEGAPSLSLETLKYYLTMIKRGSLWEGLVRERKSGNRGKYFYMWDVESEDGLMSAREEPESQVESSSMSATADVNPTYVSASAGVLFCSDCGKKVSTSARFCQWCGTSQGSNKVTVSIDASSFDVEIPPNMSDPNEIWNIISQSFGVSDVRVVQGDSGPIFHVTCGLKEGANE